MFELSISAPGRAIVEDQEARLTSTYLPTLIQISIIRIVLRLLGFSYDPLKQCVLTFIEESRF